jgi:hypothetical protein
MQVTRGDKNTQTLPLIDVIQGAEEQVTFSHPCLPRGVSQLWLRNLTVRSHRVDLFLDHPGEAVKV